MLLGFATKLKLSNQQRTAMAQHASYRRWLWNRALSWWSAAYKEGLKPTANKLKKFYTNHVKPSYPWQSQLSSRVYQYCFQDLDNAFKKFFEGGGYPMFKKRAVNDSFTLDNCGKLIPLKGVRTKLPFIGWVSTYEAIPECRVKKVTISYKAGDWHLSFAYEQERPVPRHSQDLVGVDLGIKSLATLSNGEVFVNLQAYRLAERKLKRLQRSLSRKQQGSANRVKARLKVAKAHRRVADNRKDYLHKLTSYLAKNFKTVVIEDLNVNGMMANRNLAKAIGDLGLYEFRRQLDYKCQLYDTKLVMADRWFPSTKLCSGCGNVKDMPLSERVYTCLKCGLVLDRDLNAAINLSHLLHLGFPQVEQVAYRAWGRLDPGCLSDGVPPTVPVEAGNKPQCPELSDVVSVL